MVLPKRSADPNQPEIPNPKPFQRARYLRATKTASEHKLWQALRGKQVQEVRFRRQFSIGPYFVDFVCLKARLVVEVDGLTHITPDQIAYDERRTRWLNSQGFKVIRFWNLDVLTNIERVIAEIDIEVRARLPSMSEANWRVAAEPRGGP